MSPLKKLRHSTEHILTQAMEELYGSKIIKAMGPATSEGFYFDFDTTSKLSISQEDLPRIEEKMKQIIAKDLKFHKQEVSIKKARQLFKNNPYKQEWIDQAKDRGEQVTVYWTGKPEQESSFVDLCQGPHLESTDQIKAFKLLSIAGAYWHGDENNKMLTRIYGTAFPTQKKLDQFIEQREQARQRDHKKLGKELDLFVFSDLVGPGLPMYTPKGTTIITQLQNHIENINKEYGFQKVITPHLAKIDLFKLSGHADKFSNELFHVTSNQDNHHVIKPVQCPHQTQIYASQTRSYRDLPIRYMESEKQYRSEKTGEISGLTRVIAITVEDGHSFCRVDQVKQEAKNMIKVIKQFYSDLGLWGEHTVSLSVRDDDNPQKYIGKPADWDKCENMLQEIAGEMSLDAKKQEGEAALYGPKLDFMFKDALGRDIQIPTVQLDFATPKRFNLTYVNQKGKKVPPVMVHRAVLGSYERFLSLLIEHFAGAFPLWLAPVQVQILTISQDQAPYAKKILAKLKDSNIRARLDQSDQSLGKKIHHHETQKTPYMIIIGSKEQEAKQVSVRQRGEKDLGSMKPDQFIKLITEKIDSKALEW